MNNFFYLPMKFQLNCSVPLFIKNETLSTDSNRFENTLYLQGMHILKVQTVKLKP